MITSNGCAIKCQCCGSADYELKKVYLGDANHTIEKWCIICFDFAFPEDLQKETQKRAVYQVERVGYYE